MQMSLNSRSILLMKISVYYKYVKRGVVGSYFLLRTCFLLFELSSILLLSAIFQ